MIAIDIDDVSMRFVRRDKRSGWSALSHAFGSRRGELWALRDVNLQVERGEVLGIVGRNGAGKSTLMRLMARTLRPTKGAVRVNGRVAALLSLGAGFIPPLSGRENLALAASMYGLSRAEVRQVMPSIIEFSELEDFIDMPVSSFSSGMRARLGFSVAAHADADIMLLDEVLAVGDAPFKQKCQQRIAEWVEGDHTVVMVQHAAATIRSACNRAIHLDHGKVVMDGDPVEVLQSARLEEKDSKRARADDSLGLRREGHVDRPERPGGQ